MATQQFLPNVPFVNYFFLLAPDPTSGANVPNAAGTLTFYDDKDHTMLLPIYSDVFDPTNPVVAPNPLTLGADGSAPLIYLEPRLYFIIEKDSFGQTVRTYSHYYAPGFSGGSTSAASSINFFVDGQFTYPIAFNKTSNAIPGTITQSDTFVAWGVEFLQDNNTTTTNIITFNPVANETIDGNPINELVLLSTPATTTETLKDLRWIIGNANYLEGQDVIISFVVQNKLSGSATLNVILETNYGLEGSPSIFTPLGTIPVTSTRMQEVLNVNFPSNSGVAIGDGSYVAIHLQFPLNQISNIGVTNALGLQGNSTTNPTPTYPQIPDAVVKAGILGISTQIASAGLPQNYLPYYYANGQIFPYSAIPGRRFISVATATFNDAIICTGQSLKVSDYSPSGIPYSRLYGVIGNTYGGSGSLIVTQDGPLLTFTSSIGAVQNSAYTAGTTDWLEPTNTVVGLGYGFNAELTTTSPSPIVTVTWLNNYMAPNTRPTTTPPPIPAAPALPATNIIGNWSTLTAAGYGQTGCFTVHTVQQGSGSTPPIATIQFNSNTYSDYVPVFTLYYPTNTTIKSKVTPINAGIVTQMLDFSSSNNPNLGGYVEVEYDSGDRIWTSISPGLITIALDGKPNTLFPPNASGSTPGFPVIPWDIQVPFSSGLTLLANVKIFVSTIAPPFTWKVLVGDVPTASQYFTFSSASTSYYGWFKVDGTGTDPMPGGTGIEVDFASSGATTTSVATAILTAIEGASLVVTFNVPAAGNLPLIPDGLSANFMTL